MALSRSDYHEYLDTHLNLLYFVGCCTGILDEGTEFEDFLKMDFQQKFLCREAFLEDQDELLNAYIDDGTEISKEQLAILDGFRKNKRRRFILLKCLKQHAVFKDIDGGKFYAVKSLGDSFENLIPEYPAIFELNILPFKGKIIYDGFIEGGNVKIGPNMKKSLHDEYMKAKKSNEIITSLD